MGKREREKKILRYECIVRCCLQSLLESERATYCVYM